MRTNNKLKHIILVAGMLTSGLIINAQQLACTYTHLSKDYDFKVSVEKKKVDGYEVISHVYVSVIDKSDRKEHQKIMFQPSNGMGYRFDRLSRSYTTGFNQNNPVTDDMYGDIVVADLNFDGREDIAISDGFGNAYGQMYRFFFQDSNGRFVDKSDFLTLESVEFPQIFPKTIDTHHRTLSFSYSVGAWGAKTIYFQYSPSNGKWKRIKTVLEYDRNGKTVKEVTVEK